MQKFNFQLNNKNIEVEAPEEMPLLWVLRDLLHLKGTKYGCGLGVCGICTIHLNDQAIRSCQIPIKACQGVSITTIEGLSKNNDHPIQQAWKMANVPQCGFCQPGQMMQAAAIFSNKAKPSAKEIEEQMSGVLCRCGTYPRIEKAIQMIIANDGSKN